MTTGVFPSGPGLKSVKADAKRSWRAIRWGGAPNTHCELFSGAGAVAVQNKRLASTDDYEGWFSAELAKVDARARASVKMDGRKLRRAVQMVRNGFNPTEIGKTIGVNGPNVALWVSRLPEELRP
jgi:hypothetical protein